MYSCHLSLLYIQITNVVYTHDPYSAWNRLLKMFFFFCFIVVCQAYSVLDEKSHVKNNENCPLLKNYDSKIR